MAARQYSSFSSSLLSSASVVCPVPPPPTTSPRSEKYGFCDSTNGYQLVGWFGKLAPRVSFYCNPVAFSNGSIRGRRWRRDEDRIYGVMAVLWCVIVGKATMVTLSIQLRLGEVQRASRQDLLLIWPSSRR